MDPVINNDLQLAFDFVRYTNRNIFLTGKAGTGKTTFLHNLKKTSPKRMVVLAPTGVAAINAGGVTIHSFFQLPFHPYIPSIYLQGTDSGNQGEKKEESRYKMSREKINIIRSLDLLVIDEISMVRADTLDAIDSTLRRYKNHNLPFGGVQLLMIGDLQQLAPVVKEDDFEILKKYYSILFFFGSRALSCTDYITIELKHIYRQSDQVFIDLLNKVRDNHLDSDVLNELNKRHVQDFDTDTDGGYITLTTHNYQAQALNDSKLEKLSGKPHSFKATVKDEFPEFSYPNVNELILKKGAQVMFVKNDLSRDKLYFNGKIGKVVAFEDDIIVVRCHDDDYQIRVEPVEWQNMKYTLDDETKEIQETVIGTFTQYPVRLAWAITIHKSQGLTFDRAVIDAHSAFAHGQVYVALSRCRTLNGLVLNSRISQRCVVDDPVVSDFIRETEKKPPSRELLAESKKAYQQVLLTELFNFTSIERNLKYCIRLANEHRDSLLGDPKVPLENSLSFIRTDLVEVSEKFHPQLSRLLNGNIEVESNAPLQERVIKAGEFFLAKLESAMKGIVNGFSVETDNKAVRKSFNEALSKLKKEYSAKTACLDNVRSGFRMREYMDARARSVIELPDLKTGSVKSDDSSGIIQHPGLFRLLKEWRNEKAREMDISHYMILQQKTMVNLANFVPQSMTSLKKIKGMGKKKSEKFGNELLNIIASYCKNENIGSSSVQAEEKISKKVKKETRKVSLDLYKEGKTISQIAKERMLNENTVSEHLAFFVGTGEISISEFVSIDMMELITGHFDGSEDLRTGPVKAALGEKVSWNDVKFVASHLRFIRSCGKRS